MSSPISPTARGPAPSKKCALNEDHCLTLSDILDSFSAPISEEHAWALCYQCAKCFVNAVNSDPSRCRVVTDLSQVLLHKDGHVHTHTIFKGGGTQTETEDGGGPSEQEIVAGLGLVVFRALDYGMDPDEERHLSRELERLIQLMSGIHPPSGEEDERNQHAENDDEGIERDSPQISLSIVLTCCTVHLGFGGSQEADSHYRAVCRALVAEALELSTFLENVGTGQISKETTDHLKLNEWARLWMQVVRELRRGVQLKKVCYTRKPIEFELTPYEILMEDIRSRRYKLNKVMVDGNIPYNVKKDAHAVILEFIRSRPPLRKASERKLNPPKKQAPTPREKLLESIKTGQVRLKPSPVHTRNPKLGQEAQKNGLSCTASRPNTPSRRLIKIDTSYLAEDSDDDEDEEKEEEVKTPGDLVDPENTSAVDGNPWQRTAYDLATQCPTLRRAGVRRHTVVVCDGRGSLSVPQSRPDSRQTNSPSESLSCTLPEMTWSRTSLQDDLLKSKTWQEECLSLTLEEIVHIRSVLTKAELESLPVEGRVKEDAEKRKVCFLCMKTRFGIFGPWGQICKLCKRTVCAKCHSKMRIPTEHFSHVPVVALSPSMLSPTDPDDTFPRSLASKLMPDSVGSAPSSPKLSRSAPPSQMSTSLISDGPISLPPSSPSYTPSDKWRVAKARALGRQKAEKLKGLQMTVCHDCKAMVLQIIKSSRTTRNAAIRNLTLDLSPVY